MQDLPLDKLPAAEIVILGVVGIFVNAAVQVFRLVMELQQKRKGNGGASCNYPPDLTDRLREAVLRQVFVQQANEERFRELRETMEELVAAIRSNTAAVTEAFRRRRP